MRRFHFIRKANNSRQEYLYARPDVKRAEKKANPSRNITGSTIRRVRLAALPKVTQEDMVGRLARHGLLINQSQVAKIENGERPVLDYELAAFAKALRVTVQTFFETC